MFSPTRPTAAGARRLTWAAAAVAWGHLVCARELTWGGSAGRKHHGTGELFEYDLYSSAFTVTRPDGTRLFTERLVGEPWRDPVRRAGAMGTFDVLASVTLVTPTRHADRIFEQVAAGADPGAQCLAGVNRLPRDAGLGYKVLGMETEPVQAKVRAFWELVRREVTGAPIPASRLWGPPTLSAVANQALTFSGMAGRQR